MLWIIGVGGAITVRLLSPPFPHVLETLSIGDMSGYEQYAKSKRSRDAEEEAKAVYERTVARLDRLSKQVADAPRGQSLAGKVCIVTGVGSLKGIGLVFRGLVTCD